MLLGVGGGLPNLVRNAHCTTICDLLFANSRTHQRRARKFSTTLKEASENEDDDVLALAFDYMQNEPLPMIPVQEVFYLGQQCVNIFGIHNLRTNTAKFFLYHEGEAHKSPNEVCSFLLNYFEDDVPHTVKKVMLFSDGAAGQNKNNTVVKFCKICVTLIDLKQPSTFSLF